MVTDEQIVLHLNHIKNITNSDVLAFALLEADTRKLCWKKLIGVQYERTKKIKQSATAGLTAQALRTGKAQQISITSDEERFCFGEAIMMTEQLNHVHIWPVMYQDCSYRGVIIIGRRHNQIYDHVELELASEDVAQLEQQFNTSSILI